MGLSAQQSFKVIPGDGHLDKRKLGCWGQVNLAHLQEHCYLLPGILFPWKGNHIIETQEGRSCLERRVVSNYSWAAWLCSLFSAPWAAPSPSCASKCLCRWG